MITGMLAMGATNNFVGANFILGQVNLAHPDFEIQRWQVVLVTYALSCLALCLNIWGTKVLERMSTVSAI